MMHLHGLTADKTELSIETPEGVPLTLSIAPLSDRAVALVLDVLILFFVLSLLSIAWMFIANEFMAVSPGIGGVLLGLFYALIFIVTTFYFFVFEARWHGQTPGKRKLGIRVVDRRGGPLTLGALFARNFTRQMEILLPLAALSAPEQLAPGVGPAARILAVAWIAILALVPLFSRARLRIGDWIAGTVVVLAPRPVLLDDVLGRASSPATPARATPRFSFSKKQLEHYGVYEVQVLEELLRSPQAGRDALRKVARTIAKKTGAPSPPRGSERAWLEEFYAAQRSMLERDLLFGKRREDKHDRSKS